MWRELRGKPLYWLLGLVPAALVLEWTHASELAIFGAACLAIVPLAALMGRATENISETLGTGLGGFLNATFGNAAELIIALVALWQARGQGLAAREEMYDLVRASVTGSIIGNVLLVLGLALTVGGIRHRRQTFNRTGASVGATLLALAAVGLIIPTLFYYVFSTGAHRIAEPESVKSISMEIGGILALMYGLSLLFGLRTHKHLFESAAVTHVGGDVHEEDWSRRTSLMVLVVATIGVAVMSELLVGSVKPACDALHMSRVFVGVIVVAIIGNAAEHSTAVVVASKNNLDLALNIAVGSSIQIALFVAPVLVFANLAIHGEALDLHFTALEAIAIVFSVAILYMVCQDGESNWLEGAMLLGVYAMLALAFYHLHAPAGTAAVVLP